MTLLNVLEKCLHIIITRSDHSGEFENVLFDHLYSNQETLHESLLLKHLNKIEWCERKNNIL